MSDEHDDYVDDLAEAFDRGYDQGAYETRKALTDILNAQSLWDRDNLLDLIWSTSVDDDLE